MGVPRWLGSDLVVESHFNDVKVDPIEPHAAVRKPVHILHRRLSLSTYPPRPLLPPKEKK
jgi:hypothetical protein